MGKRVCYYDRNAREIEIYKNRNIQKQKQTETDKNRNGNKQKLTGEGEAGRRKTQMERIFLLEDDAAMCRGIAMALEEPERQVVTAASLKEARKILLTQEFHLAILDVNLLDGSGIDLLRESKEKNPHVPVILLTANDMEIDQVTGLEAGADDYITKPFSLAVFRARVGARLRRDGRRKPQKWEMGPYSFNFEKMSYYKDGRPVDLSKTEQKLLRILVENKGRVVTREVLLSQVWTDGTEYVDENALSVTVKRLRTKLEQKPSEPEWLRTVYGIGYVWGEK